MTHLMCCSMRSIIMTKRPAAKVKVEIFVDKHMELQKTKDAYNYPQLSVHSTKYCALEHINCRSMYFEILYSSSSSTYPGFIKL